MFCKQWRVSTGSEFGKSASMVKNKVVEILVGDYVFLKIEKIENNCLS